jgi:hypothetical protein
LRLYLQSVTRKATRANRALEQLPLWFNEHFRVVIMRTSQTRLLGSAALRLMVRGRDPLLTATAAYLDPLGRIKYLKHDRSALSAGHRTSRLHNQQERENAWM